MTPEEVDEFARSLPGCKRKGTPSHPAWYVDDRLVARGQVRLQNIRNG